MKNAPCCQIFAIKFLKVAFNILISDYCPQFALNFSVNSWKRKTALFAKLFAFDMDYFRIDESDFLQLIFASRTIHNKKPF